MSQATFQQQDPNSNSFMPIAGAAGPQPGAVGPQSGATGPTPGSADTSQQVTADQLATLANQQTQQAIADQQAADKAQKDKSKGWSLTNPLQDAGQLWHDVESHTIAPVFHASHWIFHNLIQRPYTTAMLSLGTTGYAVDTGEQHPQTIFQGSTWQKAWNLSNDISPGQATVASVSNAISGTGLTNPTDPLSQAALNRTKRNLLFKATSGTTDAAIDWYADPSMHIGKGVKLLKGIRDVPIAPSDTEAQAVAKLNAPRSLAANEWAVGKSVNQIMEHPMVKGTFNAANPKANQAAALIAGAQTAQDVGLIRSVMAGVPSAAAGVNIQMGDVPSVAKDLDKLSQQNPDAATQLMNAIQPADIATKMALSSASTDELDQFLQKASQAKAKAAQADININSDRAQQIFDLLGTQSVKTTTSAITNKLAELRGNLKYANTRDTPIVHVMHNAMYNFPVRIYQSLTDRVPGFINHNDDQATEYVRSWLNKSSTLTPEDKIGYVTKYAQASVADRQHVWNDIENDAYQKVGQRFGISGPDIQKVLTTSRAKNQQWTQGAMSRAFGSFKLQSDEEHALLPSPDDAVITHPVLITQLEAGATPMTDLKQLETALTVADRDGLIGAISRAGLSSKDTLAGLLDQVMGVWKPLSLITGHRAYNHIGDDAARSAARIGALATVQNMSEGGTNFLRNTYARATKNIVVRNTQAQHTMAMGTAKAEYDGLLAQYKAQRASGSANLAMHEAAGTLIKPTDLAAKKAVFDNLKNLKLDFIQPKHRSGEGFFKIPGSNQDWAEPLGGPNGDWVRNFTSSHPQWLSGVDGTAARNYSALVSARGKNFGTLAARDDLPRHTLAYVHYVRNQLLPDPVAKQILQGRNLDDVSNWMLSTSAGRSYAKALHVGNPDDQVAVVAQQIKKYLPYDGMRDEALAGKFKAKTIENYMPNAGVRPDINANLNTVIHGGDSVVGHLKDSMDSIMKWTGTLPDDIMVRHPMFNSLYKIRLTDNVQKWMTQTGQEITNQAVRDTLIKNSMLAARKDMQNTLYDVSRFNDMGHTLRYISPFFNAWFNAMSSWSKLIMDNPSLLARGYAAKRALWDSPFAVDTTTGQRANENTPMENTAFVMHMPKGLAQKLGGLGDVPISAKELISPTYVDSVGNPGFGPLVTLPVNHIVMDHPALMNDPIIRAMLGNMVDKSSINQLLPSGARDVGTLVSLLADKPDASPAYQKTVWSIYQEQMYDYLNGQRATKPDWGDVETQAKYLTAMDLLVNRIMPLGFKPAASHSMLTDEYRAMQAADPLNAKQNFYDKYGNAGMMFTQGLTTDPSGLTATVGASAAVKKYSSLLKAYPELGAVIVGPEGNGNFDDMAYQWQVAQGLRKALTPQEAATQAQINLGWAQYGKARTALQAQAQAMGATGLTDPKAKDLRAQLTSYVSTFGDKNSANYNPDFYTNYGSFNQNQYQDRLSNLLTIAQDPMLLANPHRSDLKSLQAYSQKRDEIYAQLQTRKSKSLKAASNRDIAQDYDSWVADRINSDTKFAQLYDRYLAKDDWKNPA